MTKIQLFTEYAYRGYSNEYNTEQKKVQYIPKQMSEVRNLSPLLGIVIK